MSAFVNEVVKRDFCGKMYSPAWHTSVKPWLCDPFFFRKIHSPPCGSDIVSSILQSFTSFSGIVNVQGMKIFPKFQNQSICLNLSVPMTSDLSGNPIPGHFRCGKNKQLATFFSSLTFQHILVKFARNAPLCQIWFLTTCLIWVIDLANALWHYLNAPLPEIRGSSELIKNWQGVQDPKMVAYH